jgi:hypothetical protein
MTISQDSLIALIKNLAPSVAVSPLSDFGKEYAGKVGIWLRGESCQEKCNPRLFPENGDPYMDGYEAGISIWFVKWLNAKGWHLECFSYGSYHITLTADIPHYSLDRVALCDL